MTPTSSMYALAGGVMHRSEMSGGVHEHVDTEIFWRLVDKAIA